MLMLGEPPRLEYTTDDTRALHSCSARLCSMVRKLYTTGCVDLDCNVRLSVIEVEGGTPPYGV